MVTGGSYKQKCTVVVLGVIVSWATASDVTSLSICGSVQNENFGAFTLKKKKKSVGSPSHVTQLVMIALIVLDERRTLVSRNLHPYSTTEK